jgi:hypothetical protein
MTPPPATFRNRRRIYGWLITISFAIVAVSVAQDPSRITRDKNTRSVDELLLFFPSKYPEGDWNPSGLKFEDVTFASNDGTGLHAWYCPVDQPQSHILIAHGNAGHLADRAQWLKILNQQLRYSVFIFDYRGYGRSGGTPTVRGVIDDARAAQQKFAELAGLQVSEITLMGESLGGAVMVQLAAETKPKALILQSTFSSLRDVAKFHYRAVAWMVPAKKLNSATAIGNFKGPLLQSHGTEDSVVPFASAEKLHQAANEPKEFYKVFGADHNNAVTSDYLKVLDRFLKKHSN